MLEKLFFKTKMSWRLVLIFALCCGIAVGLLMIPDFLDETSFQAPGVYLEFWIAAALFIILNCDKPVEAGLKVFVFFLISQPLIYLVQVPFSWRHWQLFEYYPRWAVLTLLTLPGGMIAWFTKKGNWLSMLILSAANALLCVELVYFVNRTIVSFPHYLLTDLFIIAEITGFTLLILKKKPLRLAAFLLAAAFLVIGILLKEHFQLSLM